MRCPVCDCDLEPYMNSHPSSTHPKFLETLADIAFLAGGMRYHSGDSREDIEQFIAWAKEFEDTHGQIDWDTVKGTYIEAIEDFCKDKFINSGHIPPPKE